VWGERAKRAVCGAGAEHQAYRVVVEVAESCVRVTFSRWPGEVGCGIEVVASGSQTRKDSHRG